MPINFNALQAPQIQQQIQPLQGSMLPQGDNSIGGGLGSVFNALAQYKNNQNQQATQPSSVGPATSIAQTLNASPQGTIQALGSKYGTQQQAQAVVNQNINDLYKRPAFQNALKAQQAAQQAGTTKSPIMTVVDYSIPANQPRLWVVDTKQNKLLMNTYVAEGKGGFNYAPSSHGSETGTFVTGETYYSDSMKKPALRIRGLDQGVNDNAFSRGIVVHGGNYVGKDKQGTSWGCFTVPTSEAPALIGLTKDGTIIHAYAPDQKSVNNFSNTLSPEGQKSLSNQISQNLTQTNKATQQYGIQSPGQLMSYNQNQGPVFNHTQGENGYWQLPGRPSDIQHVPYQNNSRMPVIQDNPNFTGQPNMALASFNQPPANYIPRYSEDPQTHINPPVIPKDLYDQTVQQLDQGRNDYA